MNSIKFAAGLAAFWAVAWLGVVAILWPGAVLTMADNALAAVEITTEPATLTNMHTLCETYDCFE